MFIFKYALKSISRSLGRNILIGMIVFIIATAACIAMSIQNAAEKAAQKTLEGMSVSAMLAVDKGYIYDLARQNTGSTDMNELGPEMQSLNKEYALDLDEVKQYEDVKKPDGSPLVKNLLYSASLYVSGSEDFVKYDINAAVEETTEATEATTVAVQKMTDPQGNEVEVPTAPQMEQPQQQEPEKQGDFELVGFSSFEAMKDMANFKESAADTDESKTCEITDGQIFADNTSDYVCILNEDLLRMDANKDLKIGDKITITNPKNEDETYEFEIAAFFTDSAEKTASGGDPANTIITSYNVVMDIESKSEETNAAASTGSSSDEDSDDNEDALTAQFSDSFVFASKDDYELFKEEVKAKAKEKGVEENLYRVVSADVATYEEGLKPLENLKSFATTFLYLMLGIGAIVLIVISVISIRDRKYEIGALAAMGLKKLKLSLMFMIEVLVITLVAIVIGAGVGSAVSVPVTGTLLSAQVEQQTTQQQQPQAPGTQQAPGSDLVDASKVKYVSADDIGFSVDIFVILKMLGIGVVLAIVSGFTSILFILRYDPKQILASRD